MPAIIRHLKRLFRRCPHHNKILLHERLVQDEGFYGEEIRVSIRAYECLDCGAMFKVRRYLP